MTPQEHVTTAIDGFNQRDAAKYASVFATDAVLHDPFFPEPTKGRDGIQAMIGGIWGSFSDVTWTLASPVIASGDRMAFNVDVEMTHDGPLPMPDGSVVEPTGERITFETGVFWTLDADGLVAEERGYFDATAIALQLGLVG